MSLEPKKSKWLQEVEDDAVRITERRFKEHFEDLAYKQEKKAKNVKKEEPQAVETPPRDEATEEPETPKKYLRQMNKSELQEVAADESVEVDKDATNAEIVKAIEAQRKDT